MGLEKSHNIPAKCLARFPLQDIKKNSLTSFCGRATRPKVGLSKNPEGRMAEKKKHLAHSAGGHQLQRGCPCNLARVVVPGEGFTQAQEKKSIKNNFLGPLIVGWGPSHAKGWGSKSSFPPSKVCFPWLSRDQEKFVLIFSAHGIWLNLDPYLWAFLCSVSLSGLYGRRANWVGHRYLE